MCRGNYEAGHLTALISRSKTDRRQIQPRGIHTRLCYFSRWRWNNDGVMGQILIQLVLLQKLLSCLRFTQLEQEQEQAQADEGNRNQGHYKSCTQVRQQAKRERPQNATNLG